MWHSRSATEGSRPRASHLGYRPQKSVEFVVGDGQGSVEVMLEVRGKPGHGVPTTAFEQVHTHPLGSHIKSEALAYMEVHRFHLDQARMIASREAPEPERFTGREKLLDEVVQIRYRPAEAERDRRPVRARAAFG